MYIYYYRIFVKDSVVVTIALTNGMYRYTYL